MWRWDQQEPFGVNPADENPSGLGAFDLPLRLPGQYFDKETNLHYNYFRDYDPSLGRYEQSDPIGLGAGLNTYGYVAAAPLVFADGEGLRVTAMSRLVDDPRARLIRARHAWLYLDPDNVSQVQCLLNKQGLGGAFSFPMWLGAYNVQGRLTAVGDAPSDDPRIHDPNRRTRVLTPPNRGLSCDKDCGAVSADSSFIVNLLAGAAAYPNSLPYNPVPQFGDGYNSNSFAQGLLNSVGHSGGLGVGNTVGSGMPVPPRYFQQ